jgi:hypothetical protein
LSSAASLSFSKAARSLSKAALSSLLAKKGWSLDGCGNGAPGGDFEVFFFLVVGDFFGDFFGDLGGDGGLAGGLEGVAVW